MKISCSLKKGILSFCILAAAATAGAQDKASTFLSPRSDVRGEVRADWNKSSGLDCIYTFGTATQTPAPKGYEAFYVSHYGRHGSRYAYTATAYTTLLDMLEEGNASGNLTEYGKEILLRLRDFWADARYRVGELTFTGWEQHRRIAEEMVSSCPKAFGKGSYVYARSSPSVRSIISMSSFCLSLGRLAARTEIYEHQGLYDVQACVPNMGGNPFRYTEPTYVFPYSETPEDFFERRFPGYRDVLAKMFTDPSAALGDRQPFRAFQDIYMLVAGMNSLDMDRRADMKGIFSEEEYAIMWEADNYDRFTEYFKYKTPCKSIIDDMTAMAQQRINDGQKGADLRFGHDHCMMTLLMLMDIDGFGTVPENQDDLVYWFQTFRSPMATNLQLRFYRPARKSRNASNDEILVKVLLNGEEVHLGNLEPHTWPYYRWTDVKEFLR
ncbi:MAG: hypothetical protein K2O58_01475 [Bacteroidales bacterium]|nr:hypothetical protein [Bacteroidales bacterium]